MKIHALLLATAFMLLSGFAYSASEPDKPGSKDHPLVSRFKGASINDYLQVNYDETKFPVKAIDAREGPKAGDVITVEGKITYINYLMPEGATPLEVSRNYEEALTGKGFQVLFKCRGGSNQQGTDCGDLAHLVIISGEVMKSRFGRTSFGEDSRYLLAKKASPQGDVYVMLYAMKGPQWVATDLEIVEVQPVKTGQVVVMDAAALKKGLDADGKVAIYGIYFDTGKADVRPESKASLDEMAKLLQSDPKLKVYIVGHTDNQGVFASNLELSQHRAEAVGKSLAASYHIDAARLAAKGVASLAPMASNADERGRALNRRVELVVQ